MLVEFKLFAFIPKGFEVHSAAEPFHAVAENKHKLIIVLFHPEYFDSFMAHGSWNSDVFKVFFYMWSAFQGGYLVSWFTPW